MLQHRPSPAAATASLNLDQLRFERRRLPRKPTEGVLTAVYSDGADRTGLAPMAIVDTNVAGFGARTPVALAPGMRVSLSAATAPIAYRSGIVVRCQPDGDAWNVGVMAELAGRPAAA